MFLSRKSGLSGQQSPQASQTRSAHGVEIHKHANPATIGEDEPPPYSPSTSKSYNMSAQNSMAGNDLEMGNLNQSHKANQGPKLQDDMFYQSQAVSSNRLKKAGLVLLNCCNCSFDACDCGGGTCEGPRCRGLQCEGPGCHLTRCGCSAVAMLALFLLLVAVVCLFRAQRMYAPSCCFTNPYLS